MYNDTPPTIDEVLEKGRASYYKEENADPAYENAYLLGWLKSQYKLLHGAYIDLQKQKTRKSNK